MPAPAPETTKVPAPTRGSSRRTPRWLLIAAGVLLVARIAGAVIGDDAGPSAPHVDRIDWTPIPQAQAAALATRKPILYDFTADWCAPCRSMSREVFGEARSAAIIEGMFVPVRVLDRTREEGRNRPEVAALQQRYKIEAFPTLVVVAPDGRELRRLEGYPGRLATMQRITGSGGAPFPAPR